MKFKNAVKRALVGAVAAILGSVFALGAVGCGAKSSFDWVIDTIEKNYVGGDFDPSICTSIEDAVAQLDIYSAYYTREEYAQVVASNAGSKSGVGISYGFVEGRGAVINTVVGNSPAWYAGIESGDVIVAGKKGEERVEFTTSAVMSDFIDDFDTGEQFTLVLEDREVTLSREEYRQSYVYMTTNKTAWGFQTAADGGLAPVEDATRKMSFLPDDTAYIKLSQFYGTAVEEFEILTQKFNAAGCKSLILDLRGNGGGYVTVMQGISGCFENARGKVAMTAQYKNGKVDDSFKATYNDDVISPDVTVYALANGGTASASEALLGVLISYDILKYENVFLSDYSDEYKDWYSSLGGEVKSGRSYGKGIMQSSFTHIMTGEVLKLTTAKIYWPNGKCIHDVGLTAEDGCRLAPASWVVTKGDDELKWVVQNLKKPA